ncbi:glycerol kinase GlpK [Aliiglaciecola sp. CAU 1673]|uniref:glycerol kinase GlpK n=1 Tax=Aliiglaciecola sp. CAU 1673 TaxID=3032595 RepID=UPI0023DC5356|nr:glycerol kinase GlpK [Aliiglaciecola sp. CAU 1673]MDF2178545.1 glycerol kinase GlpK [Aliiglaciecola sp. CAU 1673]
MKKYLLALDQGTTSSRAILFSPRGELLAVEQQEYPQHFPQDGWVEHNPSDIWQTSLSVLTKALEKSDIKPVDIAGIGITNQRETTLVWDKKTGQPVYNAIVWQDRRTADICQSLKLKGLQDKVLDKTGLLLDPYFSATKLQWILDNVPGARARANAGELLFGTVDSFLVWKLSGGQVHATDATNASRTMLFNIHSQQWDEELLELFNIPKEMLPDVLDSADDYGQTADTLFGTGIPIAAVVGDQQAALVGQACFEPGMGKCTFGTGAFMVVNTGKVALQSQHQLLTTVAYRLKGQTHYALEGSIFVAGAAVKWLRDKLGLLQDAAQSEELAIQSGIQDKLYLVPAFTGLGAPYWQPDARAIVVGMTLDTDAADIVTATLQSIAYQTKDLLDAIQADGTERITVLRVDGGMVVNNWAMQFLADILGIQVDRPKVTETTALGAAMLAALQLGLFDSIEDLVQQWQLEKAFSPAMSPKRAALLHQGWKKAIQASISLA